MPETTGETESKSHPVMLSWRLTNGGSEPQIHPSDDETTTAVFDAYDVDSLEELVETLLPREDAVNRFQLGIVTKENEDVTFTTVEDRLTEVEGIDSETATAMVRESLLDIPTLCKQVREDDFVSLNWGYDWWEDAPTDNREMEQRLKEAGSWLEPDEAVVKGRHV